MAGLHFDTDPAQFAEYMDEAPIPTPTDPARQEFRDFLSFVTMPAVDFTPVSTFADCRLDADRGGELDVTNFRSGDKTA